MPPPSAPGTPQDWLVRARGHLAMARTTLPPGAFLEDLCFHAQQAAELAIKAVYQQHGWPFSFVHDLQKLLDDLQARGLPIPAAVQEADQLTVFGTRARYPGLTVPITQADYDDAIRIAEAVLTWAESLVP